MDNATSNQFTYYIWQHFSGMTERASKRANNGGGGHRPVTVGTLVSDVHAAKHLEEELESDVAEAVDGCVDPRTNFYKYCNQARWID